MDMKAKVIAVIVAIALISALLWTWLDLRLIHDSIPYICGDNDGIRHSVQIVSRTRPIAYTITITSCFQG